MTMKPKSTNFSASVSDLTQLPTYKAGVAQSSAYRMLMKFTDNAVKEYGITSMQWFMIGSIYDAGESGVTVTRLSQLLDTNVPYITNTLNILEAKNIVTRTSHDEDSRSKVITIYPAFVSHVEQIEKDLRHKMQVTLYATITPQDLLVYIKVLYKLTMVTVPVDSK